MNKGLLIARPAETAVSESLMYYVESYQECKCSSAQYSAVWCWAGFTENEAFSDLENEAFKTRY